MRKISNFFTLFSLFSLSRCACAITPTNKTKSYNECACDAPFLTVAVLPIARSLALFNGRHITQTKTNLTLTLTITSHYITHNA